MDEDRPTVTTTKNRQKYMDFQQQDDSELRRRKNNKKRTKRKDYYEEDNEDDYNHSRKNEELLPKWKICLVGAAIFLCFALLYPSVFGPMLGSFLGGRKSDGQPDYRNVHPSMVGPHPGQREARPGRPMHPHPSAAAPMPQSQQGQGGGGGRGGFAWLLPFYTIGVICFLMYTLFKSKKKPKRKSKRTALADWDEEEEDGSDEEDAYTGYRGQKLRSVQARLRKTEQAMHEILHQLELIANQSEQLSKTQPATNIPEEPTSEQQNDQPASGVTDEQTAHMEMRLKELKMLTEMCKRDQLLRKRLRSHTSTEDSEEEEEAIDEEEEFNEDNGHVQGSQTGSELEDEEKLSDEEEEEMPKRASRLKSD